MTDRPNPRPVRVDSAGRLCELDGTPIVMPGLEPWRVLASIEDERAGRMRTLAEVRAARELEREGDVQP